MPSNFQLRFSLVAIIVVVGIDALRIPQHQQVRAGLTTWNVDARESHRVCGSEQAGGAPSLVDVSPTLAVAVCTDAVVRIVHVPVPHHPDAPTAAAALLSRDSLMVQPGWPRGSVSFTTSSNATHVTVTTAKLVLSIDRARETVEFRGEAGALLQREQEHSFAPTSDPVAPPGPPEYVAEQAWAAQEPGEGLYGGGSFQNGFLNYAGAPVQLVQYNTEVAIPFLVSSKGYGILWDSNAWTQLNPPMDPPLLVSSEVSVGTEGGSHPPRTYSGEAHFTPDADGDYFFYAEMCPKFGCGGWAANVSITVAEASTGAVVARAVDWEELNNVPDSLTGVARSLQRGRTYTVAFLSQSPQIRSSRVFVQGPGYRRTRLRSRAASMIDYYFAYSGPSIDSAVQHYRDITGAAPMYAQWAYGFFQCKEHYHNQTELLAAAQRFREERIPVDTIVQDWLYWGSLGWGPHWDPALYPDPPAMVRELGRLRLQLMVSVWSKFANTTRFFREMQARGLMINATIYYDPYSAAGREQFYQYTKHSQFDIGVAALWMDATEPENFPNANHTLARGSGNAFFNSYSLMTTGAVADGLRRDFPQAQGRRVFTLTRSSFPGQQRTGAAVWTGDIGASWDSLRRQVAASLNFQLSGMPYWAQDIGGFYRPHDQYTSPAYHTLLTRWFQFGVFTPLFRVHGYKSDTELWNYGDATRDAIVRSGIHLRYRLAPYIYSGFHRVYTRSWTMQRAMVFDFANDIAVRSLSDQFMFGSALLVAPMCTPAASRQVYAPAVPGGWLGFYSGEQVGSGRGNVEVAVSLEEIPVLVRAGSVLLLGPLVQYMGEIPPDPIEVRIYPGANGEFTLYEDDGESAGTSNSTTIKFIWNDVRSELTIGARQGPGFAQMLLARSFEVVLVRGGHGVGVNATLHPDAVVRYDGSEAVVPLPRGSRKVDHAAQ